MSQGHAAADNASDANAAAAAAAAASEALLSARRVAASRSRQESRDADVGRRRFGGGDSPDKERKASLRSVLSDLQGAGFKDRALLGDLRQRLASGEDRPEEVVATPGALSGMVGALLVADGGDRDGGASRLAAAQAVANLCPLREADGTQVARQAGPALVTLLSSGSPRLREAAAVALGNLALSGPRAVKVLVNQEALESLASSLESSQEDQVRTACLYALYHLLHTCHSAAEPSVLSELATLCRGQLGRKAPVELSWVLFALSCNPDLHHPHLDSDELISKALDVLTYEIFQKSDSRPLVRIATPVVRYLSNLCAGSAPGGEAVCATVLRHPDLLAILVALLGTNYAHLSKEALQWFSNIVNCESLAVQEMLVELDFLDKMEYHTVQAIHKLDPYLTNVIH